MIENRYLYTIKQEAYCELERDWEKNAFVDNSNAFTN